MAISVKGKKGGAGSKVAEPQESAESAAVNQSETTCGVGDIVRHPSLIYREKHSENGLTSLQESIEANGLMNPISVFEADGKMYLVAGDRRYSAISNISEESPQVYKKLFPNGVPYRVVAQEIGTAKLLQAAENLSREDITSYEVAMTIDSLASDGHKTVDIARAIGRSATYVRDYIRFMKESSEDLRESLRDGDISFDDALTLMKLTEEEQKEKVSKLKEAAENAETKKQKAEAKKLVTTEVKKERGGAERATKADLMKIRDVLKEEAFQDPSPTPKYSRGMLYYATSAACEFALGAIDVDTFVNIIEGISTTYSEAYTQYSEPQ